MQTEIWALEQRERDEIARHVDELETSLAKQSDRLRESIPDGYLRTLYDRQVGRTKGTYDFAKSLVATGVDAALLLQKLTSPVGWLDPDLQGKLEQGYLFGIAASKVYAKWEFGTLQEKKQVLQEVGALAERLYDEARNSIQRQWAEAKRTGKQDELIERWKTRLLLELGTLAIGARELKGASEAGQILEDNRMLKLPESIETAKAEILPAKRVVSEEALSGGTEGVGEKALPRNFNDQPIFDSLHDVELPDELVGPEVSDEKQMRFATKELKRYLRDSPGAWSNFTPEQQGALRDAFGDMNSDGVKSVRIRGFTWNHNDMDVGKLQLVDRAEHAAPANYHEGAGTAGWVKR